MELKWNPLFLKILWQEDNGCILASWYEREYGEYEYGFISKDGKQIICGNWTLGIIYKSFDEIRQEIINAWIRNYI